MLPDALHEQVEWESAAAYADGFQDGYRKALADFALVWTRVTGEQPRTKAGTVRWLVKDIERHGVAA